MSNIIQLLPDHLANQIAAGEVVQRPASVLKELLENAVDAGGQEIKVILKDAGKSLIQIIDDGIGMSETDARMAFERHATSKLRSIDDLFALRTMGFRGEALASIAAVAQVELKTKQSNAELGTLLRIEASEVLEQLPCQTTGGTSIAVKNLFYNVPARRNFLKSNNVEIKHLYDEFFHVALAHPDIGFSLFHNDERIFELPASNLRKRIVALLGNKSNKALIPIEEDTQALRIFGYIGKPDMAKKTRGEQYFFVNNRFIKDYRLHHALMSAYEDLMPKGMFPSYVVFFEIDPSHIDINVHPTKQEIKFDDERLVYNYLRVSARHALAKYSVTPSIDFETEPGFSQHLDTARFAGAEKELKLGDYKADTEDTNKASSNWSRPKPSALQQNNAQHWQELYKGLQEDGGKKQEDVQKSLAIGEEQQSKHLQSQISAPQQNREQAGLGKQPYQLHNRYIISPIRSGLMFIDQEAAHQRILYERYLQNIQNAQAQSQKLLYPQTVQLSAQDASVLQELLPNLNALGVDIQAFGPRSFIIAGHPPEVDMPDAQSFVETILQEYKTLQDLQITQKDILARSLARQAAVPAGKILSGEEMQRLIDELFACSSPQKGLNRQSKTFFTLELDAIKKQFLI